MRVEVFLTHCLRAGASGAAFVWSLTDAGMDVMCLEQGGWVDPKSYIPNGTDWEIRRQTDEYFSNSQMPVIKSVLNRIIPTNEKMPGASEIALGFVDSAVRSSSTFSKLFGDGMAEIDIKAHATYSKGFIRIADDQKDEVLRVVEVESPDFFGELVKQTYNGYYTDNRVLEHLGLDSQPPQPRGHRLEEGDFALTKNVVKRGIAYRQV